MSSLPDALDFGDSADPLILTQERARRIYGARSREEVRRVLADAVADGRSLRETAQLEGAGWPPEEIDALRKTPDVWSAVIRVITEVRREPPNLMGDRGREAQPDGADAPGNDAVRVLCGMERRFFIGGLSRPGLDDLAEADEPALEAALELAFPGWDFAAYLNHGGGYGFVHVFGLPEQDVGRFLTEANRQAFMGRRMRFEVALGAVSRSGESTRPQSTSCLSGHAFLMATTGILVLQRPPR